VGTGAAAISGKPLTRVEVHGKNLFYFFGGQLQNGSGNNGGIGSIAATGEPVLPPGDDPLAAGSIEVSSDDEDDDTTAAAAQSPLQVRGATGLMGKPDKQQQHERPLSPHTPAAARPASQRQMSSSARSRRSSTTLPAESPSDRSLLVMVGGAATAVLQPPPSLAVGSQSTLSAAAEQGTGNDDGSSNGCDDDVTVMHIHFGMAGAFKTASLPGPEPTSTTR